MKPAPVALTSLAALYIIANGGCAAAQPDLNDPAKNAAMCAAISSDLQRLSCYDDLSHRILGGVLALGGDSSLAKDPTSQPAVSPAGSPSADPSDAGTLGAWLRNDEIDGLDRSKIIILTLQAENGYVGLIGKSGMKRGPILVLRCKEHQAQLFVSFDLPVTGSEEGVPVLFRIGANAPTKSIWSRSEDETSFGSWKTTTTAPLVNQLVPARELFVRASGSNGRTAEALFKLNGIKAATTAIQEGCQW